MLPNAAKIAPALLILFGSGFVREISSFRPPFGVARLGRATAVSHDDRRYVVYPISRPNLHHLFAVNLNGGPNPSDDKAKSKNAKKNDNKNKSPVATKDPLIDGDMDDDGFANFLQRLGQWPVMESMEDGKNGKSNQVKGSESRNPFLSPFSNVLNFEEILDDVTQKTQGINVNLNEAMPEEIDAWGSFADTLRQTFVDLTGNETESSSKTKTAAPLDIPLPPLVSSKATTKEGSSDIFKEAANRVESIMSAASMVVSPDVFGAVVQQARNVLVFRDDLVQTAISAARSRGLDEREAKERARNTTDFVADLVKVADQVLRNGYVSREEFAAIADRQKRQDEAQELLAEVPATTKTTGTLLQAYPTARAISYSEYGPAISKLAEMGWLSGGIYENRIERPHELGYSIVAEGISADVFWMVLDSIGNANDFGDYDVDDDSPTNTPIRTIVIRGFDASDEGVDREQLLVNICDLKPEPFEGQPNVLVHKGLMGLARGIFEDIQRYIDWSAPRQKIVFAGHSVGGSLSILLTLILAQERGAEFVRQKVLRVFSFGSPPVLKLKDEEAKNDDMMMSNPYSCDILAEFDLPSSLVYGSIQPWDPIPRLFSPIDGLYPLVDDLGEDGKTLYANGPVRSLRPVARALVEAWDGWPNFRDMVKEAGPQAYQHVGLQHLMLPEPVRYLTDRFVSANVNVPEVDELVRLSPKELYSVLKKNFPLGVFEVSYVTSAIRAFLHHFYPAYDTPLVDYSQKVGKQRQSKASEQREINQVKTVEARPK